MMTLYFYFAQQLNCTARDVKCLRSKSVDEIVDAQKNAETKVSSFKLLEFFEPWIPWIDGQLVKGQLLEFEKWQLPSNFTFKPFIIGSLPEECQIYVYISFLKPVTVQNYAEILFAGFKERAYDLIKFYPPDFSRSDQRDSMVKVATRWIFSCSARRFIEKAMNWSNANTKSNNENNNNNYYLYAFDFPLDFDGWDNFTFCNNHTCHGSEMPYAFDAVDANYTVIGKNMARSVISYWTNFGKHLSPNFSMDQNPKQLLNWPAYETKTRPYMRFMRPANSVQYDYLRSDCDLFDSLGYYH
jgi:carboxylesterase type B